MDHSTHHSNIINVQKLLLIVVFGFYYYWIVRWWGELLCYASTCYTRYICNQVEEEMVKGEGEWPESERGLRGHDGTRLGWGWGMDLKWWGTLVSGVNAWLIYSKTLVTLTVILLTKKGPLHWFRDNSDPYSDFWASEKDTLRGRTCRIQNIISAPPGSMCSVLVGRAEGIILPGFGQAYINNIKKRRH